MSVAVALFDAWLRIALGSFLLLAIATAAVLLIRQPARRIRVIQWTLGGLVALPLLIALPGYPRLAILPQVGDASQSDRDQVLGEAELAPQSTLAPSFVPSADAFVAAPVETTPSEPVPFVPPRPPLDPVVEVAPIDEPVVAPQPPVLEMPGEVAAPPAMILSPTTTEPLTVAAESLPIAETSPPELPRLPRDYRSSLLAAYGTGVLAMAAWSCLGLFAVWRLMRGAREAPLECRLLLRSLGGPRSDRVALVVSSRVQQPCALLWRRTTIVLPVALVAASDPQALRWALAHEWSHVERGDLAAWNASGLLRWFYFYQPLVWWLRGQLQLCQDYVADAAAARWGDMPEDYAEFLTTSSFTRPTLAAGLGIGGRISDLRRRVIMLVEGQPLESKSPRRWNLAATPVAVLLVAMAASLAPGGNRLEAGDGRLEEAGQGTTTAHADGEQAQADAVAPVEPVVAAEQNAPVTATPAPAAKPAVAAARSPQDSQSEKPNAISEVLVEEELKKDPVLAQLSNTIGNYEAYLARLLKVTANPSESESVQQCNKMIAQLRDEMDLRMAQERPRVVEALAQAEAQRGPSPSTHDAKPESTSPRTIQPGDVLKIDVQDNFESLHTPGLQLLLPSGTELPVDEEGRVSLGSAYGRMDLNGKSLEESENVVSQILLFRVSEHLIVSASDPDAAKGQLAHLQKQMQLNVRLSFIKPQVTIVPVVPSHTSITPAPVSQTFETRPIRKAGVYNQPTAQPHPVPPMHEPTREQKIAAAPYVPGPSWPHKTIQPGDTLHIEVIPEEANKLIKTLSAVEADGMLALGVTFGRVEVAGKTLKEAEALVQKAIAEKYRDPDVQITHADATNVPPGFGLPIIPSPDDEATKKLQQEIDQLKEMIRLLKKQSSANGFPLQPPIHSGTYNPYQPTAAPRSQSPDTFNPFAPGGPVGPLQFDTPPSDKPRAPEENPTGRLSQDSN